MIVMLLVAGRCRGRLRTVKLNAVLWPDSQSDSTHSGCHRPETEPRPAWYMEFSESLGKGFVHKALPSNENVKNYILL